MNLGTVVYKGKIYNLDYMKTEELKELLNKIEEEKKQSFQDVKKMIKK
jgi:hypothetical protein